MHGNVILQESALVVTNNKRFGRKELLSLLLGSDKIADFDEIIFVVYVVAEYKKERKWE